jgi:hypothetical protein
MFRLLYSVSLIRLVVCFNHITHPFTVFQPQECVSQTTCPVSFSPSHTTSKACLNVSDHVSCLSHTTYLSECVRPRDLSLCPSFSHTTYMSECIRPLVPFLSLSHTTYLSECVRPRVLSLCLSFSHTTYMSECVRPLVLFLSLSHTTSKACRNM